MNSTRFSTMNRFLQLVLFLLQYYICTIDCVNSPSPVKVSISKVENAANFRIFYGQSFKVVKNSVDGYSYLLLQNNSKMATTTKYCSTRTKSFVVPLVKFSADTYWFPVSFFELLGLLGNLKGATSFSPASECALKVIEGGGVELLNRSDSQPFSQYGAYFVSDVNALRGCNSASFLPLSEQLPLQRAEWIKFLGTFANMENRANDVYAKVKSNYLCLAQLSANRTRSFKPVVAWMQYDNIGVWSFTSDSFKLRFVEDAGGENIDSTINKKTYNVSNTDDLEQLHAILCTIDVVIDESYTADPSAYNSSSFLLNAKAEDTSCFSFLSTKSLWRNDKRIQSGFSTDWFDGAVSQPQIVLGDLIEALFPTGNRTPVFLRNVAKGEGVTFVDAGNCIRDTAQPLEPTLVSCE